MSETSEDFFSVKLNKNEILDIKAIYVLLLERTSKARNKGK